MRDARLIDVEAIDASLGLDTIVLLGQNFGLLGSFERARRLRARLECIATPRVGSSPRPSIRTREVSPTELTELLEGTGWRLSRTLGKGPSFVAIVDRR